MSPEGHSDKTDENLRDSYIRNLIYEFRGTSLSPLWTVLGVIGGKRG